MVSETAGEPPSHWLCQSSVLIRARLKGEGGASLLQIQLGVEGEDLILGLVQAPGHSRRQSVDTTGLHFQQAVPPVGPGHTEIVDRPPEDLEGLSLQEELGRVCAQASPPNESLVPLRKTGSRSSFVSHSHQHDKEVIFIRK